MTRAIPVVRLFRTEDGSLGGKRLDTVRRSLTVVRQPLAFPRFTATNSDIRPLIAGLSVVEAKAMQCVSLDGEVGPCWTAMEQQWPGSVPKLHIVESCGRTDPGIVAFAFARRSIHN